MNHDFDADKFSQSLQELSNRVKHIIFVSDYIFSDAFLYDDLTDMFRSKLGRVHVNVAEFADVVLECSFSNMKVWKNIQNFDLDEVKEKYYNNYNHLKYSDI